MCRSSRVQTPGGMAPSAIDHPYGPRPPLACSVSAYAVLKMASVNRLGAVIRSADGLTLIEHALVVVFEPASLARIVNSNVPTSVAVPGNSSGLRS